ncbi:hypothetical protein BLOT_003148 [Blomia tropicalis]|nr:hypothetical protein BLOT_003148 [Blomia tropicalis]
MDFVGLSSKSLSRPLFWKINPPLFGWTRLDVQSADNADYRLEPTSKIGNILHAKPVTPESIETKGKRATQESRADKPLDSIGITN